MSTDETRLCTMQLTYTIDDYRRLRPMPAAEAPIDAESRAEALYHHDDSENDLRRDLRATGMDGRWSMSLEVVVRRIWKQFGCFLLFLCFLLISALYFVWISARYKWRWHGFLPSANGDGVFPCAGSAKRSPLSCTDRLWDVWICTIAYVG